MSAQVYSVPGQTEGRKKAFLEWRSIDLPSKLSLTCGGNINYSCDMDDDLTTVNNFFTRFIKEINITRYGNDKQLMSTLSPCKTYQYSDAMLKHLPEKALKKLENNLLYSKKR